MKMRYVENGKTYDIDNQKLKNALISYYDSIENLSNMIKNSNIIGTYSEILVCDVLGLEKEPDSRIEIDATGKDGKTYQIKSRWNKPFLYKKRGQNEFGSFDYCENEYPFDFLILVYYEDNLLKPKVFKIHSSKINSLIGSGAGRKGKKVIFRYTSKFKKAVEQQLYISDISGRFEDIFI